MANIFQQFQKPVRSVAEYSEDFDKAENNKLAMVVERLKAQQAQQGFADDQAAREAAMSSGGDTNAIVKALMGKGLYGKAQAIQDAALKSRKGEADIGLVQSQTGENVAKTAKTAQETKFALASNYAQKLAGVRTPDDVRAYIEQGKQVGLIDDAGVAKSLQIASQYPSVEAWVQAQTQQAIPVLERFKTDAENARNTANNERAIQTTQMTNDTSLATNAATNLQSGKNNAATVGASRYSTDSAANNARLSREQSAQQFNTTRNDGKWSYDSARGGQVNTTTGEFRPVMQDGVPVEPKAGGNAGASESERTAGFLLQRIRDSQRQLEAATAGSPGAARPGLIQEAVRKVGPEAAANALTGAARQQVESAQLDILDAALTLGTGAAYTKEQLEGYRKSYFPQLNDKPPAIADKKARLENLIRAAETKAGRAAADTAPKPGRQIVRTGKSNGRKVVEYSDGTVEYAD